MATVQVEPGFNLQMDQPNLLDLEGGYACRWTPPGTTPDYNLFNPAETKIYGAVPSLSTATDFYVMSPDQYWLDLHGSFTYDQYGSPASGVITGATEWYHGWSDQGGEGTWLTLVITGLNNIDVYTLLAHLALGGSPWPSILGGGDVIEGGNGGPNHLYGFGSGRDYIIGGHSYDVLVGFGGSNTIIGAGNHDWIDGGPGVNVLKGGAHATTFAFFADDFRFSDAITNFKPGTPTSHDVLELHSLPGLRNFNQVQHHEFIYHGDVAIHDNIGDHILLANIHDKAQLHSYDFHFLA
jgi:hypothetical protein